jgi:hypothetical protein
MKRFAPLLAVFAAGLAAASFATAGPPPGKGHGHGKKDSTSSATTTSALSCHPIVSTILKGTFMSGGGTSFTMTVKHANHHGQKLLGTQTVTVDSGTKFRRNGPATLADFVSGDRLLVQARTCKAKHGAAAAAADADSAPLLAKRVVGHPAKASGSGSDDSGGASTTTGTTP